MRLLEDAKRYEAESSGVPGVLADVLQRSVEVGISEGHSREELYEALGALALELRRDGREDLEDEALEVMDVLSGWCAPSARI